jgi:hypothetical protein
VRWDGSGAVESTLELGEVLGGESTVAAAMRGERERAER